MKANYQKGKIYKIVQSTGQIVYIGSTAKQYLCQRIDTHKRDSRRFPDRMLYKYILANGGWESFSFELVEVYACGSKDELNAREAHYIRELKPSCNFLVIGRNHNDSVKAYKAKNKEKIQVESKEYYEKNKDKIKERDCKKELCVCGSEIVHGHIAHHKKTKKHTEYILLHTQ